jgi:integrase
MLAPTIFPEWLPPVVAEEAEGLAQHRPEDEELLRRLAKRALAAKAKVSGFRLHDVRRTVASGFQKLNVPVPVIEAALNHVSGTFPGVTGTYLRHDYADEIRIAMQKWADHVERLVGGKPAKIVSLRGKRS